MPKKSLAVSNLELGAHRHLGVVPDKIPARQGRHPEDVLFGVIVPGFEFLGDQIISVVAQVVVVFRIAEVGLQFRVTLLESVRHVFEEYQAEDHMLVDRRIHIGAQLVRRRPQMFVKIADKLLLVLLHNTLVSCNWVIKGARQLLTLIALLIHLALVTGLKSTDFQIDGHQTNENLSDGFMSDFRNPSASFRKITQGTGCLQGPGYKRGGIGRGIAMDICGIGPYYFLTHLSIRFSTSS